MRALVLAAGLGTRLLPLTNDKPKALVEVAGKPLIAHVLERLWGSGIRFVVVNIHHFANRLQEYLDDYKLPGLEVHLSDEKGHLLDTGGAIMHARHLLDDGSPFLVHNVDIITNINLQKMISVHADGGHFATLAVRDRSTSRSLLVDGNDFLCGWRNNETGETRICYEAAYSDLAFSGVHILSSKVFETMKQGRFSIIDYYLESASRGEKIHCHRHDEDYWLDLGRIEQLAEAEKLLKGMP